MDYSILILYRRCFGPTIVRFLVGSNGWGPMFPFYGHASGGKLSYDIWLWCAKYVAMARAGLVTVVLVGIHGDSVTRRLRRDLHFRMIFVAYVNQAGLDPSVTRFFT